MESYGFWSILPPTLAIILAIRTKQVFISLLLGIWVGWIILSGGNPLVGTFNTVQALVDVFKDAGNTRTIMFSCLVGALIVFVQKSGGTEGFIKIVHAFLINFEKKNAGKSRILVQLMAMLTGALVFVETSINILTVGSIYRPITDDLKIPREKLAYIAHSMSPTICVLIPLNAWGAYIMGLLAAQGFENPFQTLVSAFPFNFYPMIAIALIAFFIISKKDFGPMKKAEDRTRLEGKLMNDNAKPLLSTDILACEKKEGVKARAINMLMPIAIMVLMMPIMLVITGMPNVKNADSLGLFQLIIQSIGLGSGSTSVLTAVITSLLVSIISFRIQNIFKIQESIDLVINGISALIPLALLMLLAFTIGGVCKELKTGIYIASLTKAWLTPSLVPLIIFIVGCIVAFATGTSWGTFAIMIPIGVPMAQTLGADVSLTIAAALGGGVFGDNCSPISDTTLITSMACASDLIDHVKTQLPYAILAGLITAVLYTILGFIF